MHPNAQVVLRGLKAYADGDMAAMKENLADDAVWHTSGRSKWSGDHHGTDGIIRLFSGLAEESTTRPELHAVLADDDHVVLLLSSATTRGDKSITFNSIAVFHVEGGKVTEAWSTPLDQYAVDEFWAD